MGVLHQRHRKLIATIVVMLIIFELVFITLIEAKKRKKDPRVKRIQRRQKQRRKNLQRQLGKRNYRRLYGRKGIFPGGFGLLSSGYGSMGLGGLGGGAGAAGGVGSSGASGRGGGGGGGGGGGLGRGMRIAFGLGGGLGRGLGGGGGGGFPLGGGLSLGFRGSNLRFGGLSSVRGRTAFRTARLGFAGLRIGTNIGGRLLFGFRGLGDDLFGQYGYLTPAGLDELTGGLLGDAFFNPGGVFGLGAGGQRAMASLGIMSGPAIAATTIGESVGLPSAFIAPLAAAASLSGLGALGGTGVALSSLAGAYGGLAINGGTVGAGIGAGLGAGLASITAAGLTSPPVGRAVGTA